MGAGASAGLSASLKSANAAELRFLSELDEDAKAKLRAAIEAAPRNVQIGYQNETATQVIPKDVQLGNARQLVSPPTMALNGFQLVKFEHDVTDFWTEGERDKQITTLMYPKIQSLLMKECVGASKVHIFNHTLRASSAPAQNFGQLSAAAAARLSPLTPSAPPAANVKAPVKEAHSDYSVSISPLVARKLAKDIGVNLDTQKQRYSLINLWMSIDKKNPILKTPLAFCNSLSVPDEDILDNHALNGDTNMKEWDGETGPKYRAKLSAKGATHEWWYYPKMMSDEAIIFKQFDSTTSESKVCVHAALDLEEFNAPLPIPERQSVEVRAFVLFGDSTLPGA